MESSKSQFEQILLLSGMDSYIAWHYTDKPQTLYCGLGHKYELFELRWIDQLVPTTIVDITLYLGKWEQDDAFIPLRNMFLVSVGALYANRVILTVQKGELTLPDRSPKFMVGLEDLLIYLKNEDFSIYSPFIDMTKTQMVEWYVKQGLSVPNLLKTRSCYSINEKPCGKCTACFRRWVALTNNGIEEQYANNILAYEEIPNYLQRIKDGHYDQVRAEETLRALKMGGYNVQNI